MKIDVLNQYQRDEEYASMSDEEFAKARHDAFIDAQNSEIDWDVIDQFVEFGFKNYPGFHRLIDNECTEWGLIWFLEEFPETDPFRIDWHCLINESSAAEFFEKLTTPITIVNVGEYWLKHIDSFAPIGVYDSYNSPLKNRRNSRRVLKANIKERIDKAKKELELAKPKEKPTPKKKEQPPMLEFAQEVVNFGLQSPNNAGAMRDLLLYLAYKNRWPHTETEKYMKQIPFNTVNINQFNMGNGTQTGALPEPQQ